MVGLEGFAGLTRANFGRHEMRVSIARALVTRPKLLLMDEPFAALDEITRFRLNNDLLRLWRGQRWTVIFVTHSVFELVYLSSRVVVMAARPGRVVADLPIDYPFPRDDRSALRRPTTPCAARPRPNCTAPWVSNSWQRACRTSAPPRAEFDEVAGDGGPFERWFRWLAPLTLAAVAIGAWGSGRPHQPEFPPTSCPAQAWF